MQYMLNKDLFCSKTITGYIFSILVLVLHCCNNSVLSGALQLTQDNFDTVLASHELVFINFYADWCRFSNLLAPVFDESADKVSSAIPDKGKVVLGKVDCDKESSIATRFHISKYPTLKLIRNGQVSKREYRGQRSSDAFLKYMQEQTIDPVKEFHKIEELQDGALDDKKRILVGFFDDKNAPEYHIFRRASMNLKDDCEFFAGFGEASRALHPVGQALVVFRPNRARSNENDESFTGNLRNLDEFHIWSQEKCVPLVREITFENAEELTEEGLPFLILFHHPDDNEIVKKYNDLVNNDLLSEKGQVNFLIADGVKFAHPLHHLGKATSDLPIIAIDSFRHMYLFPDIKEMETPGKVKTFLQSLYSGKLHREFHYGPDQTAEIASPTQSQDSKTQPPESTFKKLGPSRNRYTLLRDEL